MCSEYFPHSGYKSNHLTYGFARVFSLCYADFQNVSQSPRALNYSEALTASQDLFSVFIILCAYCLAEVLGPMQHSLLYPRA